MYTKAQRGRKNLQVRTSAGARGELVQIRAQEPPAEPNASLDAHSLRWSMLFLPRSHPPLPTILHYHLECGILCRTGNSLIPRPTGDLPLG